MNWVRFSYVRLVCTQAVPTIFSNSGRFPSFLGGFSRGSLQTMDVLDVEGFSANNDFTPSLGPMEGDQKHGECAVLDQTY